jgi:molecular chaperone HtpG
MTTLVEKQTLGFKTESAQLLDLMIDKIYKNKEIFLRELISNAHDAIEKLRFKALSNPQIYEEDVEPKIALVIDKDNQTVILTDNGIGMTFDEVIANLGTIAKSGTKEFLDSLTGDANKDTQLIGQFGVGFYAAFMVADKVTVKTRAAGEPSERGVCWEYNRGSESKDGYTIESIFKPERGTEIILHLKKDETEFLEDWRLRSIITKYSDHITLPISMKKNVISN